MEQYELDIMQWAYLPGANGLIRGVSNYSQASSVGITLCNAIYLV